MIRKGRSLVVEESGRLLGFVVCEAFGREVHVWALAVRPERQRAGIGSHLLRAALVDARASGFAALTVTARRDTFWERALRTGLGFAEVDAASHPRLGTLIRTQVEASGQHGSRVPMIRFLG
nr:GNAT family N-acetyltransferase [Porphyrobacter sp. GA68]